MKILKANDSTYYYYRVIIIIFGGGAALSRRSCDRKLMVRFEHRARVRACWTRRFYFFLLISALMSRRPRCSAPLAARTTVLAADNVPDTYAHARTHTRTNTHASHTHTHTRRVSRFRAARRRSLSRHSRSRHLCIIF